MSQLSVLDVPGLVCVKSQRHADSQLRRDSYQFTADATSTTVEALPSVVSEVCELMFFDAEHPQISDPGAYINLVRSPDGLLAQSANHGWSSSWIPITHEEAARYLRLCMPFNTPPSKHCVIIWEPSNWRMRRSISRWRWASLRRTLNKRLKGAV